LRDEAWIVALHDLEATVEVLRDPAAEVLEPRRRQAPAFGEPTIAVDTHIFRVANRTGLARGATVGAVEATLLKVVPPRYRLNAHHWLILLGRYTCKARRPACWRCHVREECAFRPKTQAPPGAQ